MEDEYINEKEDSLDKLKKANEEKRDDLINIFIKIKEQKQKLKNQQKEILLMEQEEQDVMIKLVDSKYIFYYIHTLVALEQ